MKVHALAFEDGQRIPDPFTGDGSDASPALKWEDVPPAAKSLALIVDDPDAPRPEPWVHWLVWNIPPDELGLPEGVPRQPEVTLPDARSWKRSGRGCTAASTRSPRDGSCRRSGRRRPDPSHPRATTTSRAPARTPVFG